MEMQNMKDRIHHPVRKQASPGRGGLLLRNWSSIEASGFNNDLMTVKSPKNRNCRDWRSPARSYDGREGKSSARRPPLPRRVKIITKMKPLASPKAADTSCYINKSMSHA